MTIKTKEIKMKNTTENSQKIESTEDKKGGFFNKRNEVLGFRILPDSNNWTVVLIKKRGEDSKNPGEEYTTDMGYFKNLTIATSWILNQYLVQETLSEQKEIQTQNGEIASLIAIEKAFAIATQKTQQCIKNLEDRMGNAGYNLSPKIVKESLES